MSAILMTEEYWMNSQFSFARHYGGIKINGNEYVIVNKDGKSLRQLSAEAERKGNAMAIPAGEPADLIDCRFQKYYRKLGRDRFIETLERYNTADARTLQKIFTELITTKKQ